MSRTALYRHFRSDGTLLYVGISLSAVQRLAQHKQSAQWFAEIARVDVEWLGSREEALTAEAIAIAKERPKHNIQGADRAAPPDPLRGLALGVQGSSRGKFFVFPPWAENEVRCRGEHLDPIVWQNEQWAVTTFGLELREGTYVVEASRLWLDEAKAAAGESWAGWVNHMRGKGWVDMPAFTEALNVARVVHTGTDKYAAWATSSKRRAAA